MIKAIPACRICESRELTSLIDLGEQYLTGIFPATPNQPLTRGTLELIKCDLCGLVQLRHSYDLTAMYGPTYGYRSGLNKSMVAHLQSKTAMLQKLRPLKPRDAVLDIGSSDGTLLGSYPQGIRLVGIDPSAEKFRQYYRPEAKLIVDFFSAEVFRRQTDVTHAKIVTSIAMFYDLEMPLSFVEQVRNILAPDGVWHLEQSYLPLMLKVNAYDTICHEHLEYYGLKQIKWMMDRARLKIIDVQLNDINGGSFAITVAHEKSSYPEATEKVNKLLQEERDMGLDGLEVFRVFKERVFKHRNELIHKLQEFKRAGKLVLGYGASTKGNVILQFCGITSDLLPAIMEVNPDKFGCYTPGTKIPIISEIDGHARNPDYLLVLPWHFKENVIQREAAYLKRGGKLLFPLPEIHTV
jgi:cyclopropane fatty-acyl-phospholipid synthase-like methyltransferase